MDFKFFGSFGHVDPEISPKEEEEEIMPKFIRPEFFLVLRNINLRVSSSYMLY